MPEDVWAVGAAYEPYVGRWSRVVASAFLGWLDVGPDARWVDVGCGTGAVTQAVLAQCSPTEIVGVDPSEAFVGYTDGATPDPRARFAVGSATAIPLPDDWADAVVSGLVLNFVPEPAAGVREMTRVGRPGATIGAYIWDYTDGMQMMRHFWDAAAQVDPAALELDEGARFPLCRPDGLRALFVDAGLDDVRVEPIVVPTVFADFDDFWSPFLGGQGAAPAYAMTLSEEHRSRIRERLRGGLPYAEDGSIRLTAKAWAVRGRRS